MRLVAQTLRASLLVLCLHVPQPAVAEDVPYWPSEREARLEEVEQRILGVRRRIAAAVAEDRDEEAQRLLEELADLQRQERILRSPPRVVTPGTPTANGPSQPNGR